MPGPALTDAHLTAWVRLMRLRERVVQAVEAALKAEGLPPLGWYDLLLELTRTPEGLRPYQLQAAMLIAQPNMSRLIDRVEKAGLITRRACDEDGRGLLVTITEAGRAMQMRMWPVYRAALAAEIGARFSPGEAKRLAALLGATDSEKPAS